jgi:cysteine desulfurase
LSAHKLGGPVGVGALIVRGGPDLPVYSHGGGQEGGIRSGTVDVAGAAAFAAAWDAAVHRRDEEVPRVRRLRDLLGDAVREADPTATVRADDAPRLDTHLHVTFPGCEADVLLMLLDAAGVEVSTGAACSVGIPQPSHVLLAMGATEAEARGSLRFSLGWASTEHDIAAAAAALGQAVSRARRAAAVAPAKVGA